MIEKYGEGLGSTDRTKLRAEIEKKLTKFYQVQDKTKLEDKEHLAFIVDYALKFGLHNLNTRLQGKYGCNLSTIMRQAPRPPPPNTKPGFGKRASLHVRNSLRNSLANFTARKASQPANLTPSEQAEMQVQSDLEYQEYLRKLVEVFYARHDPNRLLEEGVSPIIDFAINSGEDALNAKLRKKYKVRMNLL